jgi:hypothetical protein
MKDKNITINLFVKNVDIKIISISMLLQIFQKEQLKLLRRWPLPSS